MTSRRAGQRRHLVELQRATPVRDDFGGFAESWLKYAEVYASVVPAGAKELQRVGQVEGSASHVVEIDHRGDVKVSDRIILNARVLNISGVINDNERDKTLVLTCQEVLDG